ncbi:putative RFC5-DNA replication factor C, 40 kd subunit [Microstroma glucosiphilum]|uniref:Putative RFC5-DNA replication factor C, 40 kd subunit n=1 Tax=Pseudomicrostroma glucosiphilum TaxID=1684307 RepID=A0A316TZU3_9BASI|nr:putative RFC5-DNA replication factor C, 40 kd subunit [Pseudomicrostroma glucosiphilum]PWN18692.1 putative RFC5-DNA replication factor C, 40 kd subunit [Pseudomicrostroma glucosiphilum]
MLFVDKHRPKSLADLSYHEDLSERLRGLADSEDLPHLLFYGPSGAGKKTRIHALIKELFGPGAHKLKIDQRVFLNPSKRKIDVNIISSTYHQEITPSDAAGYDRLVIQDVLKEIAQTQQVDVSAKHRFKVVVINEADSLSRDAQSALRRTMEKYMGNLRLILCATSTSKIIAPIRSRCLLIRVAAPNEKQMTSVLHHVAKKEKFHLPDNVAAQIYADSGGNLRKAVLVLEALRMQSPDLSGPISIAQPDWELYIHKMCDSLLSEQTPQRLLAIRNNLYELLVHAIPPKTIIKSMVDYLVTRVDESLRIGIVEKAAFFEGRTKSSNKAIFHLEAFAVAVMTMIKSLYMGIEWDE